MAAIMTPFIIYTHFLNIYLKVRLFCKYVCTLWLYQLLQKHLLICRTKLHYIDFYGPLMPSSHIDIW